MNWLEYKELSEKTLSKQFHVSKQDELLLHALLGVATELEELLGWNNDDVNKQEEVADVFWYLAILDRELNLNFDFNERKYTNLDKFNNYIYRIFTSNDRMVLDSYKKCSLLLDFLKKKIYYNKPINIDEFSKLSNQLFESLILFSDKNNIDISYILDRNIQKLKARYGEKFTSERAINRDLETERKILEGN